MFLKHSVATIVADGISESDAAKYARGRLALQEMLAQFEREASVADN